LFLSIDRDGRPSQLQLTRRGENAPQLDSASHAAIKKKKKLLPPHQAGTDLVQAAKAGAKAAETAVEVAKAHTFVVYTRNTQRATIDAGGAGPSLGDQVIASGDAFATAAASGAPLGRFDVTLVTTAVLSGGALERRQVNVELAFNAGVVPDFYAPVAALKSSLLLPGGGGSSSTAAAFSRAPAASGDALELSGGETCPLAGGLPLAPVAFAVTGGTGALVGARGQVLIEFDAATAVFKYTIMLL